MCIIFVYAPVTDPNDPNAYKLIIASNRDEFYARPAQSLVNWTDEDNNDGSFILGGRDMEPGRTGGTWLAIGNRGGRLRLAALLNITGEPHSTSALGRGFLVNNYLSGERTAAEYCAGLLNDGHEYNGFNLVTVEIGAGTNPDIRHCSKTPSTNQKWPSHRPLCFGNSPPHTPLVKVTEGRTKFEHVCATAAGRQRDDLLADLWSLLDDRTVCWPDDELQRRGGKYARNLSSICVRMNGTYGTRTHSVILIDGNNRLDFYERTMSSCDPDGDWQSTHITKQVRLYD